MKHTPAIPQTILIDFALKDGGDTVYSVIERGRVVAFGYSYIDALTAYERWRAENRPAHRNVNHKRRSASLLAHWYAVKRPNAIATVYTTTTRRRNALHAKTRRSR